MSPGITRIDGVALHTAIVSDWIVELTRAQGLHRQMLLACLEVWAHHWRSVTRSDAMAPHVNERIPDHLYSFFSGRFCDDLLEFLRGAEASHLHPVSLRIRGALGDDRIIPACRYQIAEREGNVMERVVALTALGALGTPEALQELSQFVTSDSSSDDSLLAAICTAENGERRYNDYLEGHLEQSSWQPQIAFALAVTKNRIGMQRLQNLLHDGDETAQFVLRGLAQTSLRAERHEWRQTMVQWLELRR